MTENASDEIVESINAAPTNFSVVHLRKVKDTHDIDLTWDPVVLDEDGCFNGVKVVGYKLYKDKKFMLDVIGPETRLLRFQRVGIKAGRHMFGIRYLAEDGHVSQMTEDEIEIERNLSWLILPVAVGVGSVVAAPFVLAAAGFTSTGIVAGSVASKLMSMAAIANGGGVAAGGIIATLQSLGAAGLTFNAGAAIFTGTTAATAGAMFGLKKVFEKDGKEN